MPTKWIADSIRRSTFYSWITDSPTELPLAAGSKGRWIGAFAIVGGIIGQLVTIALGTPKKYIIDYLLDSGVMLIGFLTFKRAEHIPRTTINGVVAISTVVISVEIATGSGMDPSSMAIVFYVWIALFCFSFLSTYESIAQIAFVILTYSAAAVFGDQPSAPLADWILTVSTVIVAAISSGYLNYTIRKLALTDSLTSISNRKGWDLAVSREISRAKRSNMLVMVGIIDLNHFKKINDEFGHFHGDKILQEVAKALQSTLRPFDVVARWGGDEFVFLALIKDSGHAKTLLQRISSTLEVISKHRCGAVVSRPVSDTLRLVSHADKILYQAKAHSENSFLLDTLEL